MDDLFEAITVLNDLRLPLDRLSQVAEVVSNLESHVRRMCRQDDPRLRDLA